MVSKRYMCMKLSYIAGFYLFFAHLWKIRGWYNAVFRLGQETHEIPFVD